MTIQIKCQHCGYCIMDCPVNVCPECGIVHNEVSSPIDRYSVIALMTCVVSCCLHAGVLAAIVGPFRRPWMLPSDELFGTSSLILIINVVVLRLILNEIFRHNAIKFYRIGIFLTLLFSVLISMVELAYIAGYL